MAKQLVYQMDWRRIGSRLLDDDQSTREIATGTGTGMDLLNQARSRRCRQGIDNRYTINRLIMGLYQLIPTEYTQSIKYTLICSL